MGKKRRRPISNAATVPAQRSLAKAMRTDEDFTVQLGRLHERLVAHLRASHEGRHSAMDDLAVVLRVLACRGQGDDALRSAIRRFGLQEPTIVVSPPAERYPLTLIAFGGIAAETKRLNAASRSPVVEMTMSAWLDSLCLVNPKLLRRHHTWNQLITDVANTNGAHLSGSIPQPLGHPSMPTVTGADLCTYLLHSAAAVLEESLRTVLDQLGVRVVGLAMERNFYVQHLHIFGSQVTGDWQFVYGVAGVPASGVALVVPAETHMNGIEPLVLSFHEGPGGKMVRRVAGPDIYSLSHL